MEEVLLIAAFEVAQGTDIPAPYIEATVADLCHQTKSEPFKCRIDTGADITVLPKAAVNGLRPLLRGKSVLTRGHCGEVKIEKTCLLLVNIGGITFRPERGVLLADRPDGLLGLDIIRQCELHLVDDVLTLKGRA